MKSALIIINDGLSQLKAFKLAIGQQNLLKISDSLLNISSSIKQLYGDISGNIITSSTNVPPLLKLQESLYYFVNGVPENITVQGYKILGTANTIQAYYINETNNFWYNTFSLNNTEKTDITNALNLINSLNSNIGNNVNLVMNNPDVQNLRNSLLGFQNLNNSLLSAQLALASRLGGLGFTFTFTQQVNQPSQ
jgi:hypothetical protein